MNYFEASLEWLKAQTTAKKIGLAGGLILIGTLTISLIIWAFSPSYGVLFNQLDDQDANQILSQLEQSDIAYQVRNQGRDILIDKRLIDKTRIKLIGSGIQLTHTVGFELFDKTDFGMTDFSQKINYQRALQGELERTISSFDEVKQVRVHLVIPENHLFEAKDNLPRAAVTLHLKKTLTAKQVRSIQQLISASVPKLPLDNVIIVDQNGNGLTTQEEAVSSNHFAEKQKIERYLNEKVMQMLNKIFGDESVMVKIDATLNYDELERELVKPQHGGLITHEKETQHAMNNKTDKGVANQDFTREKSYQFGQEKEHFTKANGTLERLTISVVLPHTTPKEQIVQVERLVKSMVGFDTKRGDTISIEALIVNTPPTMTFETIEVNKPTNTNSITYVAMAGLATTLVLALGLRIRSRMKNREILLRELTQWLIEND